MGRSERIRKRLMEAEHYRLIDNWHEGGSGKTRWLVKPRHETSNYYTQSMVEAFLDGIESARHRCAERMEAKR